MTIERTGPTSDKVSRVAVARRAVGTQCHLGTSTLTSTICGRGTLGHGYIKGPGTICRWGGACMGHGRRGSLREVKSACGWRYLRRCEAAHWMSSQLSSSDLALRARTSSCLSYPMNRAAPFRAAMLGSPSVHTACRQTVGGWGTVRPPARSSGELFMKN